MRRAFVMGSNGPAGSTQLRYVLNDVENMRTVLSDSRCSFEVDSPNPNSTIWGIYEQLANITDSCTQDDTFICYFSGHGRLENGSLYLLWNESHANRLSSTALSVTTLMQHLSSCKAHSKLLILDCCHAGAVVNMLKSGNEVAIEEFVIKPDNHLILMASSRHQLAREVEELKGSFLTANICDALSKKLDAADFDRDGRISIGDLHNWLKQKFKEYNEKIQDKEERVPLPYLYGQFKGDDIFFTLPPSSADLYDTNAVVKGEKIPYQALSAFCKNTAEFFFGRNQVVSDIHKALEQHNFILLIGASGSGKSSVVKAGLIPLLEETGWQILEVVPWVEPVSYLKYEVTQKLFNEKEKIKDVHNTIETNGLSSITQLIPGEQKILIIVDQFEEVFTVCSQESEQRRFIEFLTQVNQTSTSRLKVIVTLRADFIEDCLKYQSLTRLIQNQSVWIPELEHKDLKQVITEPAQKLGYSFDEGLPESIIEQIGQEKNFLPLLQFALTELWKERDQKAKKLTATQYLKKGGVLGALNRRAEETYQSFSLQEQVWLKKIFLKLVRTGPGEKDTRQRQPKQKLLAFAKDTLEEQQAIRNVLDKLVNERLLVAGKDIEGTAWIDLAHEAIMDGWKQFALWRQEDRELRRLRDRVEDAYGEWIKSKKDACFFMMGGLLIHVTEKWSYLEHELSPDIREFYELSKSYQGEHDEFLQHKLEEQKHQYQLEFQKYQIQLENKEVQLEIYREQTEDLKKYIEYLQRLPEREIKSLLAEKDARIFSLENMIMKALERPNLSAKNYNFYKQDDIAVTNNRTINTGGGNYNENITGDYIQGNYYDAQKQSLTEAAAEIQQLLKQLEQSYPSNTTVGKMTIASEAVKHIESDPTQMERVLKVLEAGNGKNLEQLLSHPAASFVIGALKDWQKNNRP